MSHIPSRDITGRCDEGECRNRVSEGEMERQRDINRFQEPYSGPSSSSPSWSAGRNLPPGAMGGRV